jgi:hypothetical protein
MLPTYNSYSSTSNPHAPSEPLPLRVHDDRQVAGGETPLSKMRRGGIQRAVVQLPAIAVACRANSPPAPKPGSPAADAATLLFLPPALSLVHPTLYLPTSILVLLTPARNSVSLPPPRHPPMATTTPMTSAALMPRWTRQDDRPRATQSTLSLSPLPTTEGGGRRTLCPVTPGIMQPLCQVPQHGHPSSLS